MNKWTAHFKNTENSKVNLICFPYAGGSASYFAAWARLIPEDFGLIPILYPMRELRMAEDMPETIDQLADMIADEAGELFERPYIVFGHCTGAILAYEVIIRLIKKGGRAPLLYIASSEPSPRKTITDPRTLTMSEKEFADYMVELRLIDKSMAENKDFMDYYFPSFRADFLMHQRFVPEGRETGLPCPVIGMRGEDDNLSTDELMSDWENYTSDYTFHKFSGGHFYLNEHAKDIIAVIKEKYDQLSK